MRARNTILATTAGAALFGTGYMATERLVPEVSVVCEETTEGQWVGAGAGPAVAATYVEGCEAGDIYPSKNPLATSLIVGNLLVSITAGFGAAAYLEDRESNIEPIREEMSELRTFYGPEDIRPFYPEIVPAYQEAFKNWPWYEVSKCVADEATIEKCIGGLSSIAMGATCEQCGNCPMKPAYEYGELVSRFEVIGASRPTIWYTERNEAGLTLAAVVYKADAKRVATEKYGNDPAMQRWLEEQFPACKERRSNLSEKGKPYLDKIAWLDEVFADQTKKESGNLASFGAMCIGIAEELDVDFVAFRTINPKMVSAAKRAFGDRAQVMMSGEDVPDRRDFVIIDTMVEIERNFKGSTPEYDKTWTERVRNTDISESPIDISMASRRMQTVASKEASRKVAAATPYEPMGPPAWFAGGDY